MIRTLRDFFGLLGIIGLLSFFIQSTAFAGPNERARRLHNILTATQPDSATLATMSSQIAAGNLEGAAATALGGPKGRFFYDTIMFQWSKSFTNMDNLTTDEFNDSNATIVGLVRDEVDFRNVLTGDELYVYLNGANIAAYEATDNDHHRDLEVRVVNTDVSMNDVDFQNVGQAGNTGITNGTEFAGILLQRGWGAAYWSAGTNRRGTYAIFEKFMCRKMEDIMDVTRPADRIRRDVERTPGNDPSVFNNTCKGCHAGMDGLTGAFAYIDFRDNRTRDDNRNLNSNNHKFNQFPNHPTYRTVDSSWVNFWADGGNSFMGWSGATSGVDPLSIGTMYANAHQFAVCMASHAFKQTHARKPASSDMGFIAQLTNNFIGSGYNYKEAFINAAIKASENE